MTSRRRALMSTIAAVRFTNPATAAAGAVLRRPRPAFAVIGLGAAVLGMVGLLAVSSIQAFVVLSQQSSTGARSRLSLELVGDDGETAAGPDRVGAVTRSGQPTAPVGRDQMVRVHGILVHHSIADDVRALIDHAAADGITLSGWGWRDGATQIRLRRQHCGTSDYAIYRMPSSQCRPPTARPGRSQHERGLAIDFTYNGRSISTRSNPGFRWLAANAAAYGLSNLASEPWHWSTTGR